MSDDDEHPIDVAAARVEIAAGELALAFADLTIALRSERNPRRDEEETETHIQRLAQIANTMIELCDEVQVETAHYAAMGDA